MARDTRYQGAIIKDHHLLLLRYRDYETGRSLWVFPGGGIEEGETEEECVAREMLEETHLTVEVERLLFEMPHHDPTMYQKRKVYLCAVMSGEAKPGYEPEEEVRETYGIVEVKWFDLRAVDTWDKDVLNEVLHPQILKLETVLGY
jgi:8-oxo-dGTP diphosphatase